MQTPSLIFTHTQSVRHFLRCHAMQHLPEFSSCLLLCCVRLTGNHGVLMCTGWDHQRLTQKLLQGNYKAVISDSTQLVSISNKDEGCNLYILPDRILPFDIALAFAKGFPYPELKEGVDAAIVQLQEGGILTVRCLITAV